MHSILRQRLPVGNSAVSPQVQRTLFDYAPPIRTARTPPTNRTDTSRAAAERAAPKFGKRQRAALAFILSRHTHGATIEEISVAFEWLIQSTCPVVNSLAKAGEIVDSGARRKTRAGCEAKVWIATNHER